MGISYHRRVKIGDDTYLNLSKSGTSISKKVGNSTINLTKGTITTNLGNGMVYRGKVGKPTNLKGKKNKKTK